MTNNNSTNIIEQCKSFLHYGMWRCYDKDIETYPKPYTQEFRRLNQQILANNAHITSYQQKVSLAFDRMTSPSKFWGLIASGTGLLLGSSILPFIPKSLNVFAAQNVEYPLPNPISKNEVNLNCLKWLGKWPTVEQLTTAVARTYSCTTLPR